MIINDNSQFAFVHIPKSAGTTVRQALSGSNDWREDDAGWIAPHPYLGKIDYAHLPLFVLEKYFNSAYVKIEKYRSYAVIRDPFERFPSSVFQRLKMYSGTSVADLNKNELIAATDSIINQLMEFPREEFMMPPDFVHFQRQTDYVVFRGRTVVGSVYTVHSLYEMYDEIIKHHPGILDQDFIAASYRANSSVTYKNALAKFLVKSSGVIYPAVRPVKSFMSPYVKARIKSSLERVLYSPSSSRFKDVFYSDFVLDFIGEFYEKDIKIFDSIYNKRVD